MDFNHLFGNQNQNPNNGVNPMMNFPGFGSAAQGQGVPNQGVNPNPMMSFPGFGPATQGQLVPNHGVNANPPMGFTSVPQNAGANTGNAQQSNAPTKPCGYCRGSGVVACNTCNGSGRKVCDQCDRYGRNSRGKICTWCKGNKSTDCACNNGRDPCQCTFSEEDKAERREMGAKISQSVLTMMDSSNALFQNQLNKF